MEHQFQQTLYDQRQEENNHASDRSLPGKPILCVGDPAAHGTEDEDGADQIGHDGRNRSEDIAQNTQNAGIG